MAVIPNTYWAFGKAIYSEIDLSNFLPLCDEPAQWFIYRKAINESPKKRTKIYRQGLNATYHTYGQTQVLNWEEKIKFAISQTNTLWVDSQLSTAETALFTLAEGLGLLLIRNHHFLLHASAVAFEGKALVFCGVSGAGKSTTAAGFVEKEAQLLTDDLTLIQIIDHQVVVVPAYPQLKLWDDVLPSIDKSLLEHSPEGKSKYLMGLSAIPLIKTPVPLSEIVILQKPSSKKVKTLNSLMDKIKALTAYFPMPSSLLKGHYAKQHFETSVAIAKQCVLKKISRPQSLEELAVMVNQYKTKS